MAASIPGCQREASIHLEAQKECERFRAQDQKEIKPLKQELHRKEKGPGGGGSTHDGPHGPEL